MKKNKILQKLFFGLFLSISFLDTTFAMEEQILNTRENSKINNKKFDLDELLKILSTDPNLIPQNFEESYSQPLLNYKLCDSCDDFFETTSSSDYMCPDCEQLIQNLKAVIFPENLKSWTDKTILALNVGTPSKVCFNNKNLEESVINLIEKLFYLIRTKGIKLYFEPVVDGTLSIPKEFEQQDVSILRPQEGNLPFILVTAENNEDEKTTTIYPEHAGILDKVFQDQ